MWIFCNTSFCRLTRRKVNSFMVPNHHVELIRVDKQSNLPATFTNWVCIWTYLHTNSIHGCIILSNATEVVKSIQQMSVKFQDIISTDSTARLDLGFLVCANTVKKCVWPTSAAVSFILSCYYTILAQLSSMTKLYSKSCSLFNAHTRYKR